MDSKTKLKHLMKKSQQERKDQKVRIESPLVKYNSAEQPMCIICGIVIKSEALWDPHCASKKHLENLNDLKQESEKNKLISKQKEEEEDKNWRTMDENDLLPEPIPINNSKISKTSDTISKGAVGITPKGESGVLPEGFFDNQEWDTKIQKEIRSQKPVPTETNATNSVDINKGWEEFQESISTDLQAIKQKEEQQEDETLSEMNKLEASEVREREEKMLAVKNKGLELKRLREQLQKTRQEKKQKKTENEGTKVEYILEQFDWKSRGHL